ncbi:hypothetical protein SRA_09758 [Streptococcus ratti FA-1 = DSM 20564]|uniref:Transposase n=1 Tax=Streptococcus ratti FA-1 = DSM 20564 TaxID=699248 RepID=A0ABP2QVV8_STRRT|nr:hypothetical protein SRA_09758 [Streptococcus ratti FA-1 = DSM 20564]
MRDIKRVAIKTRTNFNVIGIIYIIQSFAILAEHLT